MSYEIESNISIKGATRKERLALHSANIGKFVRVGTSHSPRALPKPPKFGRAGKASPHGVLIDRLPLALDPLFRSFKGDSKAARIKDTGKRAGPRKVVK